MLKVKNLNQVTKIFDPYLNAQRLEDLAKKGFDISELPKWTSKLIFSSYFENLSPFYGYKRKLKLKAINSNKNINVRIKETKFGNVPVSLRILKPELDIPSFEGIKLEDITEAITNPKDNPIKFPFQNVEQINKIIDKNGIRRQNWITKEDQFEDSKDWFKDYGRTDVNIPPTDIPCGGCGAFLHCQDHSIPGYIASEIIKTVSKDNLRGELCQRCYFLSTHNIALKVNVTPSDYNRILYEIKEKKALVLLVVDLLDFPCSLWPQIVDLIGEKRPVILVGNKVDLLPRDSEKYLQHLVHTFEDSAKENGLSKVNIVYTTLISATTGFGVENLIDCIFERWGFRGDIYIIGCTNVGKSSLFNAFLQSDLCKIQAVDLIQRATISPWPGTTLNLLKFPVTRPQHWRMHMRRKRIQEDQRALKAIQIEREAELRETKNFEHATLIGHIGRTMVNPSKMEYMKNHAETVDAFNVNPHSRQPHPPDKRKGEWDPNDPTFSDGKWCFDTPGAVAENQILDQLTLKELMLTLPKRIITPRTYRFFPDMSMFIAGLARVDFVKGNIPIRLVVFTSEHLPVNITMTKDADEVYNEGLGTPILGVPFGTKERLSQFPKLIGKSFTMTGIGFHHCTGDIVISSAGWIGVNIAKGWEIELKVFTPNGKGTFCRIPSFLPNVRKLKGMKIRGSLSYSNPSPVLQGKLLI